MRSTLTATSVRSEQGNSLDHPRKGQVDFAFGIIQETLGFRRFSLRGQPHAAGAGAWDCLTCKLRKNGRKIQRIARTTGQIGTIARLTGIPAAPALPPGSQWPP